MTDKCFHCGATSPGNADNAWWLYKGLQLCEKCSNGVKQAHAGTAPAIYMYEPEEFPPPMMDIVDRLEHPELFVDAADAAVTEIRRSRQLVSKAAQRLIEEIGTAGPEYFEKTTERAAEWLNVYRRGLSTIMTLGDRGLASPADLAELARQVLKGDTEQLEQREDELDNLDGGWTA